MGLDLWLIMIPSCPDAWLFVDSEIPIPNPIRAAFWYTEYTQSSLLLYGPASVEGGITEHIVCVYICMCVFGFIFLYIHIYKHTRC